MSKNNKGIVFSLEQFDDMHIKTDEIEMTMITACKFNRMIKMGRLTFSDEKQADTVGEIYSEYMKTIEVQRNLLNKLYRVSVNAYLQAQDEVE